MKNAFPKITQIEQQLANCSIAKDELETTIQLLENKLSPILKKRSGEERAAEPEIEIELVPLANSIRKIAKDMEFFNNEIRSIIDRLEI